MKAVKIILTVVAWLGLLVILMSSSVSAWLSIEEISWVLESRQSWDEGLGLAVGFFITLVSGYVGVFMALVGGLVTRPRYFNIAIMVIGAIYILSFISFFFIGTEMIGDDYHQRIYVFKPHFEFKLASFFIFAPGLLAIAEGIVINYLRRRQLLHTS